jgi:radical SAM protein with 4Fe4S-binding SPASM domain
MDKKENKEGFIVDKNFSLQWHLTARCPYGCKHCYLHEPSYQNEINNELNTYDSTYLIYKFKKFVLGMNEEFNIDLNPLIRFTGGDPLLRKDFFELLSICKDNHIKTSILGNPDLVTEEVAKKLKDNGLLSYQISLDGMKHTHNLLRGKDSFDVSIKTLKLLKKYGIRAYIMFNFQKSNIKEVFPLFDYITENDLGVITFSRVVPTGKARDLDLILSPLEYRDFLYSFYDRYKNQIGNGTIVLKETLFALVMHEKGDLDFNQELGHISTGCEAGISFLSMQGNGDIHICRRMNSFIGNAIEDSFEDIFYNSNDINEIRDYDNYEACGKCELKNMCRGCPAISKETFGSIKKKDPQCWKVIH